MKKGLPALLFACLITIAGCKKEEPSHLTEINAHIIDGGSVAADGLGYYIKLDSTQEQVIALNLPSEYKTTGINAPVAVKFVETGRIVHLGMSASPYRVVYLSTIRKL